MPGKFTQIEGWRDISAFRDPIAAVPEGAASVSARPMWGAQVMRLGEDGRPELARMRWAFPKAGAEKFEPGHMHARGETVDSLPRFCDAFGERRGILPVETFNVKKMHDDSDKGEQWVMRPRDRKPVGLGVIWEEWEGGGELVSCFCMITVPANALLTPFEDRMPAVIEAKDWPVWLGQKDAPYKEIKALLRPYDDGSNWELSPQAPAPKKGATPKPPPKPQMDLF